MKGNEFLDKMELVDPAYVEAADQMPGSREPINLKTEEQKTEDRTMTEQKPTGQKSERRKTAEQKPTGQKSEGQTPADQKTTGQKSEGQTPADQKTTGQKSEGQTPAGRKPDGGIKHLRWWAAAACFCIICGGALFTLSRFSRALPPNAAPSTAGPEGMGTSLPEGSSLPGENSPQENSSFQGNDSSQGGGSSRGNDSSQENNSSQESNSYQGGNPSGNNPSGNLFASAPTSDTYANLEQLLSRLSSSDYHGEGDFQSNGSSVSSGLQTEGRDTVSSGEYTYQLSPEKEILIYQSGAQIGSLSSPADFLFLTGNRLIAVRTMQEGIGPDSADSACVDIYDLSSPGAPEFLECFVQQGSITACFLQDTVLCLMTSDGVCACGWSRLKNNADYIPDLSRGNRGTLKGIEWTQEEIRILGEPSRVKYVAVTNIDVIQSEVIGKCAYYGDIEDVFYGPGWYAFCTESVTDRILSLPELYTFDFSMNYTGKVDTSLLFGLEKTVTLQNGSRPAGEYPDIVSVSRCGEIWTILGMYRTLSDTGDLRGELFAAAYDPASGRIRHAMASTPESSFSIDDVFWEENRAIVSAGFSSAGSDGREENARIIFAEFDGTEIVFQVSDLLCDRVRGIDMVYWMGNPYGSIRPFISLGNGIYLRYNSVPDGFDIYDFRDSSRPECLYRSEGDIPRGNRLDFENRVYDEHTVGVKMLIPENGEYRNMTEVWCIFSIDPRGEDPVKKLKEYKSELQFLAEDALVALPVDL